MVTQKSAVFPALAAFLFSLTPLYSSTVVQTSANDFSKGIYSGFGTKAGSSGDIRLDFETNGVGSTATTAAIPQARVYHAIAAWNGKLYISGGTDGGAQSAVYSATPNPDGTIGSWTTEANALPAKRYTHSMSAWNGRLYVAGGKGEGIDDVPQSTVYSASITESGGVGPWAAEANSLPQARSSHAMDIWNGRIYVTGGLFANTSRSTVYSAPIKSDGSVGAWRTEANSMNDPRYNHAMSIYNGRIYIAGGYDTADSSNVYSAAINADGAVGAWALETKPLPASISQHSMSASGRCLFISAGTSLLVATITASGNVGAWNGTVTLPSRTGQRTSVWNNVLYITGGMDSGFANQPTVFYVNLKKNSRKEPWTTEANSMPETRTTGAMAECNGRLYFTGGWSGGLSKTDVFSAPVNGDGSVGVWRTEAKSLPDIRSGHAMAQWNGWLYVAGGLPSNTVYRASVTESGYVGTWVTDANSLPQNLDSHAMAAYDGRLYVTGGINSGNWQSTVYSAALSEDGSVGVWTTESNSLPDAVYGHGMAAYEGRLYIAGGNCAGNRISTTTYSAPVNGDGSVGTWKRERGITTGRKFAGVGVLNEKLYFTGGQQSGNGVTATIYSSSITGEGALAQVTELNLPSAVAQHCMLAYNGRLYIAGGCDPSGNNAVSSVFLRNE